MHGVADRSRAESQARAASGAAKPDTTAAGFGGVRTARRPIGSRAGGAIRDARSAAMTVVCMPFGLGAGPAGRIALWSLLEAIAVLA